jgi:hypothetical protein
MVLCVFEDADSVKFKKNWILMAAIGHMWSAIT